MGILPLWENKNVIFLLKGGQMWSQGTDICSLKEGYACGENLLKGMNLHMFRKENPSPWILFSQKWHSKFTFLHTFAPSLCSEAGSDICCCLLPKKGAVSWMCQGTAEPTKQTECFPLTLRKQVPENSSRFRTSQPGLSWRLQTSKVLNSYSWEISRQKFVSWSWFQLHWFCLRILHPDICSDLVSGSYQRQTKVDPDAQIRYKIISRIAFSSKYVAALMVAFSLGALKTELDPCAVILKFYMLVTTENLLSEDGKLLLRLIVYFCRSSARVFLSCCLLKIDFLKNY